MIKALVIGMIVWIHAHTGLPLPHHLPRVQFMSEEALARYTGLKPDSDLTVEGSVAPDLIILKDGFDPGDIYSNSILLHELVHIMQQDARVPFPCVHASEPQAYFAQYDWLAENGVEDPWKLMGSNPMTVAILSQCGDGQ